MLTVLDLQSAMIEAMAQTQDWEREFQEEWNAPLILAEQTMAFLSLSPEESLALKESDPELHEKLSLNVKRLVRRLQPAPKRGAY